MNSLELYTKYFQENRQRPFRYEQKSKLIDEVIRAVCSELNTPPFESPFINALNSGVTLIDAYTIIGAVKATFADDNYSILNDRNFLYHHQRYFFTDTRFNNNRDLIATINQNLNYIDRVLEEIRTQYAAQINDAQNNFQAEIQPPPAETPTLSQSGVTQAAPPSPIVRQPQQTAQPVQIPAKPPQENSKPLPPPTPRQTQQTPQPAQPNPMDAYTAQTNAKIELQKYINTAETRRLEQRELCLERIRQNVSAYRKEQEEISLALKNLQMPAQQLLENLRGFSDRLIENYIAEFAIAQIELYNLIWDNIRSHEQKAAESQNPDYCAAVANCNSYLEMISDALSNFGVEEISTDIGAPFDGKLHEVKNTRNFSPRYATIKKSLRAGFKFGDRVLQKEEVAV